MIYIYKQNNEIITDNIINFIPDTLDIYLDDIYIGNFINKSTSLLYLKFDILLSDIEMLQEREYKLNIYTHEALIKTELCIIKDDDTIEIKSITKQKQIVMYE